jgi:hypothetical protein
MVTKTLPSHGEEWHSRQPGIKAAANGRLDTTLGRLKELEQVLMQTY